MEDREKKKSSYEDVFAETHKRKDGSLDAHAQSRYDHMLEIRERNPEISDLDMAEEVFGSQNYGSVIGMGTRILASKFRGTRSREALRKENSDLREAVERMKSSHELFEKSITERLEQVESLRIAESRAAKARKLQERADDDRRRYKERIEMEKRMEAMMLRFLRSTPTSSLQPPTSVPSPTSAPSSAQQDEDEEDQDEQQD